MEIVAHLWEDTVCKDCVEEITFLDALCVLNVRRLEEVVWVKTSSWIRRNVRGLTKISINGSSNWKTI